MQSTIYVEMAPGDLYYHMRRDPLYIDDLETILDEGSLAFNLQIEDGSVEEVAEELMIMHEECLSGNFVSVERLIEASHNPAAYPHAEQVNFGTMH
ncbi:hypothetical protein TSUD_227900 [Trifolium subterraneum]|uniref:Uncharacterized protein n=1 Tax=Trifolium subterraneum TaxID=3900 RepID=A0A2Z6LSF4_TRISU|nr:hypothetical protein TSUD_227900 [Trifolium subterraneum]